MQRIYNESGAQEESEEGSPQADNDAPESEIELDFSQQPLFRAKLYKLDQQGRWHDKGTGHFLIEPWDGQKPTEATASKPKSPQLTRYKMTLKQEHPPGEDLLQNELIQPHVIFQRQRDTIITWSDSLKDQDLAVSFQNIYGAQQTWKTICSILGKDPSQVDVPERISGEGATGNAGSGGDGEYSAHNEEQMLNGSAADGHHYWQVTLENLPRLAEDLADQNQK